MVLKIDSDTIKLQKVTYDVIFMTSQRLRHRKFVIKMTLQNVSIFKPLPQQNPGCAPAFWSNVRG